MKLILCPKCADIVRLRMSKTMQVCTCGQSKGRYTDNLNAEYSGKAIPLGIANSGLIEAIRARPDIGDGSTFEAWVMPKDCPTFKKV